MWLFITMIHLFSSYLFINSRFTVLHIHAAFVFLVISVFPTHFWKTQFQVYFVINDVYDTLANCFLWSYHFTATPISNWSSSPANYCFVHSFFNRTWVYWSHSLFSSTIAVGSDTGLFSNWIGYYVRSILVVLFFSGS